MTRDPRWHRGGRDRPRPLDRACRARRRQHLRLLRWPDAILGRRPPSTWDRYGIDGNQDGRTSPYDPADAIPAAARYLRASGAPGDYHSALFAYNHADPYVAAVLAKAAAYRGGAVTAPLPQLTGNVGEVLRDPRIVLTPIQRTDLHGRLIDPRVVSALAAIAREHTIVVTALRSDHSVNTVDGNRSNHSDGRAVDIGAIDGDVPRHPYGPPRQPRARARCHGRAAASDRADPLLGP